MFPAACAPIKYRDADVSNGGFWARGQNARPAPRGGCTVSRAVLTPDRYREPTGRLKAERLLEGRVELGAVQQERAAAHPDQQDP